MIKRKGLRHRKREAAWQKETLSQEIKPSVWVRQLGFPYIHKCTESMGYFMTQTATTQKVTCTASPLIKAALQPWPLKSWCKTCPTLEWTQSHLLRRKPSPKGLQRDNGSSQLQHDNQGLEFPQNNLALIKLVTARIYWIQENKKAIRLTGTRSFLEGGHVTWINSVWPVSTCISSLVQSAKHSSLLHTKKLCWNQ